LEEFQKQKDNKKSNVKVNEPYAPGEDREINIEKNIFSNQINRPKDNPMGPVAFNFIHINIMSSSESQNQEKQQMGRVTPDNTMVKVNKLMAPKFRGESSKMVKSMVVGAKKKNFNKILLNKINKDLRPMILKNKNGVREQLGKQKKNKIQKGWAKQFKKKKFIKKTNESVKSENKKKSKEKKAISKSQSKKPRVNPRGEYGVNGTKSLRPKRGVPMKKFKKTRSRNKSGKSEELNFLELNRNSDPGENLTQRTLLKVKKKPALIKANSEQIRCLSLNNEKKKSLVEKSLYSRIKNTFKRPLGRTPIIRSKKSHFGNMKKIKEAIRKLKKSPDGGSRKNTPRKGKNKPKSISKSKKKNKITKLKNIKVKKWYKTNQDFNKNFRDFSEKNMKRLINSVKVDKRHSRFGGGQKVKKLAKFSSIDKTKNTDAIKEEDEPGYFLREKERSRSTKADFKLGGNKKSKLLQNIQRGQRDSAIKSINNIRNRKKEVLNESQSVDKYAKYSKFKFSSGNQVANHIKFQKPMNISSSKKLKNLTGKKYPRKQKSGRGILLEKESGRSKPAVFNEYAQKEKGNSKEKTPKASTVQKLQTPRSKKYVKSFKNVFSTKYSDRLKNIGSMRQPTSELKNPFDKIPGKSQNLRSPKNKKIKSNKEIMKLPFSHLRKSAKKKVKKKSSNNLNENKKKLLAKKSKKKLSIEKKLKQMRLENKEKSPIHRPFKTKSIKDTTSGKQTKKIKPISRSPLNNRN
jgi:hypothetical protein